MTHGGRARAGARADALRPGRVPTQRGRPVAGTGSHGYAAVIEMPGMAWREKAVGYTAPGRSTAGRSVPGRSTVGHPGARPPSGRNSGAPRGRGTASRSDQRSGPASARRATLARQAAGRPRRAGARPEPPLRLTRRGRVVLTMLGTALACLLLWVALTLITL